MRNSYIYYGFNKHELLKALLNISNNMDYISVLVSNLEQKDSNLPKDYINYDFKIELFGNCHVDWYTNIIFSSHNIIFSSQINKLFF